ncbi:hypothetical protein D3C84_678650 [compost metagenome]
MLEEAFRRHGIAQPALRVEADFSSTTLYQLIVDSRILTLARYGREFLATGLVALDLDAGELELDRRIGMVTRAEGYLSPVCSRMIELFKEEIVKKEILQWL